MIEELKALRAVVESKSLTAAAESLHLTQSAISRRIQQLEETLGGALLDRASRPPTPTLLGNRVYERSQAILSDINQLIFLASENAVPAGVLRLGVTHAIGDIIIAASATKITQTFPLLDLRLRTAWSTELLHQVAQGSLDAAIVLLPEGGRPASPAVGKRLTSLEVVVVQSKSRPIFRGKVRMTQLANQGWILNPQGCGYRSEIERAIGLVGKDLRIIIDTYGTDIQLRMIASGLGIGLVPRSLLLASSMRNDLAVVDVQDFHMTLDMWLVHPKELGNLTKAIDVFEAAITTDVVAFKDGSKQKPRLRKSAR